MNVARKQSEMTNTSLKSSLRIFGWRDNRVIAICMVNLFFFLGVMVFFFF